MFNLWITGIMIDEAPDSKHGWFMTTDQMKMSAEYLCEYFKLIDDLVDFETSDEAVDALLEGASQTEADLIRVFL